MPAQVHSLERLVPDAVRAGDVTGGETLALHLERYEFAARCARPGRLLDLACGVGYGTRLLADRRPDIPVVLGVDCDREAIAYARERYGDTRTHFRVGDAMAFADDEGFDTIVSLETLEHLPRPAAFVGRLVRLLRPGGVLIASAPTTPSVDVNPHHLHDFSERGFRRLFAARGLREGEALQQAQRVSIASLLRRDEARLQDVRPDLAVWYAAHPGALARRLAATLRYGFANRYLTVAWRLDG